MSIVSCIIELPNAHNSIWNSILILIKSIDLSSQLFKSTREYEHEYRFSCDHETRFYSEKKPNKRRREAREEVTPQNDRKTS